MVAMIIVALITKYPSYETPGARYWLSFAKKTKTYSEVLRS